MGFPRRRISRTFLFTLVIIFILFFEVPDGFSVPFFSDSSVAAAEQGQNRLQYFHPIDIKQNHQSPPVKTHANTLGRHRYRPDGLLEVNEQGPHPIYELIARAEKEWEGKLARASKTLEQAVTEYRKRYNRLPPKGFDLW